MKWLIIGLVLLPTLAAAEVSFEVRSDPQGVIAERIVYPDAGTLVTTPSIDPERTDFGLRFTHWSLSPADQHPGCNATRCVDPSGQSLLELQFEISANTVAVAHFIPIDEDLDEDGLPDSLEQRYFGDLSPLPEDDSDGDGVPLSQELRMGLNPRLLNVDVAGGAGSALSPLTSLILVDGQVFFYERSNPRGLIDLEQIVPLSAVVSTVEAAAVIGQFYFAYWDIDGVIQRDASGAALSSATKLVEEEHVATAHYIPAELDSDLDDVPDWFEMRWFQDLGTPNENTADGDSLSLIEELMRNTSPTVRDEFRDGGVTRSAELRVRVFLESILQYTIRSQPVGLFPTVDNQVPPETVVWTSPAPQMISGHRFSRWEVDGQPQLDAVGTALKGSVSFEPINPVTETVAKYFLATQDTDSDGLPDWFEHSIVTGEELTPQSDPDLDGMTLESELARGFSPLLAETERHGGITRSQPGPIVRLLIFKDDFDAQ